MHPCHLLFHSTGRISPLVQSLMKWRPTLSLVDHHGEGILGEFAVILKLWPSPDGLYLIKGGGSHCVDAVPRIRKEWRKAQGIIFGKRFFLRHLSQNIGRARGGEGQAHC